MKRKLDKITKDINAIQNETLLQRLAANKDTVYGKAFNFTQIKSREDFVKLHPLTRISHYESYIQRMMDGEEKVLTDAQPIIFAVTSGTSGKSSELPMISKQRLSFFLNGVAVAYHCMLESYPKNKQLQKSLKFFYTPSWRTSKSGILIGPNSSSPSNSKSMLSVYSTPKPGFDVISEPEALYIHLLFGLKDSNIGMLEANFSSTIYNSLRALDIHWKQLVVDIERGEVNPDLDISQEIREKLNGLMKPDSQRANEICDAFKVHCIYD